LRAGVDPLRILAITFTDKAANNMRDRLAHAFRDRAETRGKLERAYVSTVHGFCARLLKENAVFAGLDPEFHVMDERESAREQRRAIDETLDSMFAAEPDRMRALMRGLAANDAGGEVLDAYDAIRAAGVKVGDLARFAAPPSGGHRRGDRRKCETCDRRAGSSIKRLTCRRRRIGWRASRRRCQAGRRQPCGPCGRSLAS
jgi:ATP-dependent helicase/nuclease subunit A